MPPSYQPGINDQGEDTPPAANGAYPQQQGPAITVPAPAPPIYIFGRGHKKRGDPPIYICPAPVIISGGTPIYI